MISKKRIKFNKRKSYLYSKARFHFIFIIFIILFLLISARLWYMQIIMHENYADISKRNHFYKQRLIANRGDIFFFDKVESFPVAVNRDYFVAYIEPNKIKDYDNIEDLARKISNIEELNVSYDVVLGKLSKHKDPYEELTHKLTKEQKEKIISSGISEVKFLPEKRRFYPGDTIASQVIGFVGQTQKDGYIGRYGIEAYFEEELRGTPGWQEQEINKRGNWIGISDRKKIKPKDGVDIYLTIDYVIQKEVEKILAEDSEKYDVESGSVIVMNPTNGDILALANLPTFSLNEYNKVDDIGVYRNSVVSDEYEPGSVMKTITLAIGLDLNKINSHTTYEDKGVVSIGGYKIKNSEGKIYGVQDMTQVLEKSINTGSIYVEQLVGNKNFKNYLEQFGFGSITGIDLPAEADGNLNNLNNLFRDTEYATASFGHGITVTPIQLISAYGAIANKGNLMKPRIVIKKVGDNGEKVELVEPKVIRRVISEDTSKKMGDMLEMVITGGHAKLAGVKGYRLGGKTGTAQVAKKKSLGYEDDDYKNTTFVGYGPIDEPRFVILVKYDNPKNADWAATSAAPTFGRIAKFLLEYYNIPPIDNIK